MACLRIKYNVMFVVCCLLFVISQCDSVWYNLSVPQYEDFIMLTFFNFLVYYCYHYLVTTFIHVFTIIYLQQIMFLGYIVLELFCIYKLCYM